MNSSYKINDIKILLPSIFVLTIALNILPIGLINVGNFDVGKLIVIVIYILVLPNLLYLNLREYSPYLLFLFSILVSSLVMVLFRGKYFDWTVYYCLQYIYLILFVISIKSYMTLNMFFKIFLFLCFLATIVHLIFYIQPGLLDGQLTDIRMGSIRSEIEGLKRVFIPGMGYIAIGLIYVFLKVVYNNKISLYTGLYTIFFCFSLFIAASVRTYFLGIILSVVSLLIVGKINIAKFLKSLTIFLVLVVSISLINDDIRSSLSDRFQIFLKISDFQIVDILTDELNYSSLTEDQDVFATVYWRALEVPYILSLDYSNTERYFGKIGLFYDFLGVEDAPAPHFSLAGIYYLFGLFGVLTFLIFIIFYSISIFKFAFKVRDFYGTFFLSGWNSLLAFSIFGGVYYSEMIIAVCIIIGGFHVYKNIKWDKRNR